MQTADGSTLRRGNRACAERQFSKSAENRANMRSRLEIRSTKGIHTVVSSPRCLGTIPGMLKCRWCHTMHKMSIRWHKRRTVAPLISKMNSKSNKRQAKINGFTMHTAPKMIRGIPRNVNPVSSFYPQGIACEYKRKNQIRIMN